MYTENMYDINRKSHLLAFAQGQSLSVLDSQTGEMVFHHDFPYKVVNIAFSDEGIFLYILLKNGLLSVLDCELLKIFVGERIRIKCTEGKKEIFDHAILLPLIFDNGVYVMQPGSRYHVPLNDYLRTGSDGKFVSMLSLSTEMFADDTVRGRSLLIEGIINNYEEDKAYVLYGKKDNALLCLDMENGKITVMKRFLKDGVVLCHVSLSDERAIGLLPDDEGFMLSVLRLPEADDVDPKSLIEKELIHVKSVDDVFYPRKSSFLSIRSEKGRKGIDLKSFDVFDIDWPKKTINLVDIDNLRLTHTSSSIIVERITQQEEGEPIHE